MLWALTHITNPAEAAPHQEQSCMGCCKQNLWLCSPPNIRICLQAVWKKTLTLIHLLLLGKTAQCSLGQEGNSPSVTACALPAYRCWHQGGELQLPCKEHKTQDGCPGGPAHGLSHWPLCHCHLHPGGCIRLGKEHWGSSQPHGVRCSWKRVLLSKEDIVLCINWSVFSLWDCMPPGQL